MKNRIILWSAIIFVMFQNSCTAQEKQIRTPAVSGQFYPSRSDELRQMVDSFLKNVSPQKVPSDLYGIIVPHAGYVFSGQVAAYGFKQLQTKQFDTVILIGQSHNFHLNKAAVYSGDAFSTPLGDVPVDNDFVNDLVQSTPDLIEINNPAHIPEHSLEVEIPFLQSTLKNYKIVPILVSQISITNCEQIARAIVEVIKKHKPKKVLFVISTDMTHYPEYKTANEVNKEALDALEKYDPLLFKKTNDKILSRSYRNLSCVFCGEQAVIIGMYATKLLGANKVQILHYANSGDIEQYGDKNRVVGYCSVAFVKEEDKKTMVEFSITEKNQKLLLDLARRTIKEYIKTKKTLPYQTSDPELTTPRAIFVTLSKNHQLRGCIGTTVPQLPLYQAVQQMAVASGFEDWRFSPVSEKELPDIKIEISVLSELTRVKGADEIKQNIHGVVVRKDGRSGLFLPQVWEHFSKKENFLNELCAQKAGLEPTAWSDPQTELYIFTVFKFEEK